MVQDSDNEMPKDILKLCLNYAAETEILTTTICFTAELVCPYKSPLHILSELCFKDMLHREQYYAPDCSGNKITLFYDFLSKKYILRIPPNWNLALYHRFMALATLLDVDIIQPAIVALDLTRGEILQLKDFVSNHYDLLEYADKLAGQRPDPSTCTVEEGAEWIRNVIDAVFAHFTKSFHHLPSPEVN